jgi:hypothetical protein
VTLMTLDPSKGTMVPYGTRFAEVFLNAARGRWPVREPPLRGANDVAGGSPSELDWKSH